MLRANDGNGKGESFCVDGDLKRVAGRVPEAVIAYLNGYVADPHYTQLHLLDTLTILEKENVIDILQNWLKNDSNDMLKKRFAGIRIGAIEIWKFIFMLDSDKVNACVDQIENQMKEKRFKQVVYACTAIIDHSDNYPAPVLVQRAVAYTLDGSNKLAVSDCLRAFAKDKDGTVQVLRDKHGAHLPHVSELLRAFVYSKPIGKENQKSDKWLKLTTDCCKLLLAMDSNNFTLQMTYVERLTIWNKLDQAISTLNEIIRGLYQEAIPDRRKLAECWIRLGYCCFIKPQNETAKISNITRGLNLPVDFLVAQARTTTPMKNDQQPEYDITKTFLEDNYDVQYVGKIGREILTGDSTVLHDVITALEKAAVRLNSSEKVGATIKLNTNVQQAIDCYRAILVLKPRHRDTLLKLASCYSKIGRHNFAIKIYDNLLSRKDYAQDSVILTARAACYREIGKKNEAKRDYDVLLRHSPMDATLLFERSLVHLENSNTDSLLADLEAACKSNQRTVSMCMNKLPLTQRTQIRELLYDRAQKLLRYAQHPVEVGADTGFISLALSITQLLTKLNSKDYPAHLLKAHSFYYLGSFEDADVTLKRLLSNNNPENSDNHIIKLHLGLLRIFMNDTDKGISNLVTVLAQAGEQTIASFTRDLSSSQQSRLYAAVYSHAVAMLHKTKDNAAVQKAISCFTISINCCYDDPVNSSEFRGLHGLRKSYLARAECYAHLGNQENAILDFTSALEVNPTCVDALCGRAFMRLALGVEQDCVNDIVRACGVDMITVTAHIAALPEDAKGILLHWLDQHVISLLLQYGGKDGLLLNNRRSSTVSITVETDNLISSASSPSSTESSPSQSSSHEDDIEGKTNVRRGYSTESTESKQTTAESRSTDIGLERVTSSFIDSGKSTAEVISIHSAASDASKSTSASSYATGSITYRKRRGFHKSSADVRKLTQIPVAQIHNSAEESIDGDITDASSLTRSSRPTTSSTTQTSLSCDDVISGVEKAERLSRAQIIGKLLIAVDPANPLRHGMYADIFILKGEYQESLRHLQMVMDLSPMDVTAVARAGLIYAKQNQYEESANLLSSLFDVDWDLLMFVLKALDSTIRRRLSEESHHSAVIMIEEGDFDKAIEYFGLSLVASDHKRLEKLRLRALCLMKLKNSRLALEDMMSVIKEAGSKATAMDYCSRGHIYLVDNKDKEACSDYSKALKIDLKRARLLIHSKPGLAPLSRVFHRQALEEFISHRYDQCFNLCDDGILIDDSNIELRKLRARARKEVGNCVVQ